MESANMLFVIFHESEIQFGLTQIVSNVSIKVKDV